MFFFLQKERKFEENRVTFYMAQLVLVTEYLLNNGSGCTYYINYSLLVIPIFSPTNVYLSSDGYIKMNIENFLDNSSCENEYLGT